MAYDREKDQKLGEAIAKVDDILSDEFLPKDIQIQRLAWLRGYIQKKVQGLKAT
jgi:hypothetical protein